MLEKLMQIIGKLETQHHDAHANGREDIPLSSFYPLQYPEHVFHKIDEPELQCHRCDCYNLPPGRRFLPCHYFDYICGSGSGA